MSEESESSRREEQRPDGGGLDALSPLPGANRPLTFYRRCLPEVATAWIGYVPRRWPAAEGLWVDLAARRLGAPAAPSVDWHPADAPLEDLVYLPPTSAAEGGRRDRLVRLHRSRGTPVLEQVRPGERTVGSGVLLLYDLLETLLENRLDDLADLPQGCSVIWPLAPGLSDERATVEAHATALVSAGVSTVHFVPLELDPASRRTLADRLDEGSFERVFHGHSLSQREVAGIAIAAGLDVFLERPLPEPPLGGRGNRAIAASLYLAAELWTQLDRAPEAGQALFRAAREADRSRLDLVALAREDNLSVLGWLDGEAGEIVRQLVGQKSSALLEELRSAYRAPDPL